MHGMDISEQSIKSTDYNMKNWQITNIINLITMLNKINLFSFMIKLLLWKIYDKIKLKNSKHT